MQDNRRNQYIDKQPLQQANTNYEYRDSNQSFKRTRTEYEAQHNKSLQDSQLYDQNTKGGIGNRQRDYNNESVHSLKANEYLNRDDLYNRSNQETVYNVGKYNETPMTGKIVTQPFRAPNEPKSFRVMTNPNTQSNNNQFYQQQDIIEENQQQQQLQQPQQPSMIRSRTRTRIPSNQMIREPMTRRNINQTSEFDYAENTFINRMLSTPSKFISSLNPDIHWKKEYNKYAILCGAVCAGGCISYLVYHYLEKNKINVMPIIQLYLDKIHSSKEKLIFVGVVLVCGIVYYVIQQKSNNEAELMAREDYENLKDLLDSTTNQDDSGIGIFIDFFIQTRTEYWNVPKLEYEKRVLPVIKRMILLERVIEECNVIVSNQTLRAWKWVIRDEDIIN